MAKLTQNVARELLHALESRPGMLEIDSTFRALLFGEILRTDVPPKDKFYSKFGIKRDIDYKIGSLDGMTFELFPRRFVRNFMADRYSPSMFEEGEGYIDVAFGAYSSTFLLRDYIKNPLLQSILLRSHNRGNDFALLAKLQRTENNTYEGKEGKEQDCVWKKERPLMCVVGASEDDLRIIEEWERENIRYRMHPSKKGLSSTRASLPKYLDMTGKSRDDELQRFI